MTQSVTPTKERYHEKNDQDRIKESMQIYSQPHQLVESNHALRNSQSKRKVVKKTKSNTVKNAKSPDMLQTFEEALDTNSGVVTNN